jgi:hypothetical protein
MEKSFDRKLTEIQNNPRSRAFILVDAKDPDMAWGISCTGEKPPRRGSPRRFKSRQEFYEDIRALVKQATLDMVLASVSTMDVLARQEGLFLDSPVTPAVRYNDTSDIWLARGSSYAEARSRPFASSSLRQAVYGTIKPLAGQKPHVDLGLYSMTFNDDLEGDLRTLEAFRAFREQVELEGVRYFLEVFDPNMAGAVAASDDLPGYINDQIVRSLAGVPLKARPVFLKIVYHGPAALEELVSHDSSLVVGILGGSSGTTYDAFKLIAEAQKYGARAATFGRKIKNAEDPLIFVEMLRHIVDGDLSPEQAVKSYHGALKDRKLKPIRSLEDDLQLTDKNLKYLK